MIVFKCAMHKLLVIHCKISGISVISEYFYHKIYFMNHQKASKYFVKYI